MIPFYSDPISMKLKGFIFLLNGLFAFIFLKRLSIEGLDMVICDTAILFVNSEKFPVKIAFHTFSPLIFNR